MKITAEVREFILNLASCAIRPHNEGWIDIDSAVYLKSKILVIFAPEILGWDGNGYARNIACVVDNRINWFIRPDFVSRLPSSFDGIKWDRSGNIYVYDDREYRYDLNIKTGRISNAKPIEELFE